MTTAAVFRSASSASCWFNVVNMSSASFASRALASALLSPIHATDTGNGIGSVQPEEERRKGGLAKPGVASEAEEVPPATSGNDGSHFKMSSKITTATGGGAGVGDPRGKGGADEYSDRITWTPRTLASSLDYYVIGQEFAKRTLAVGVYNHYKRLNMKKQASLPPPHNGSTVNNGSSNGYNNLPWQQHTNILPPAMIPYHSQSLHHEHSLQHQHQQLQQQLQQQSKENSEDVVDIDTNLKPVNEEVELDKSNILLCGPTGSGKTLLVKTLARFVNVPFVIADATTLTQA